MSRSARIFLSSELPKLELGEGGAMEKQKKSAIVRFPVILWAVMTVLLFTTPALADFYYIDVSASNLNSPYNLDFDPPEDDYYFNVSSDGTLNLWPGGYASFGVYVNTSGNINIYGSHEYSSTDTPIQIAGSANATLFTDSTDSIELTDTILPTGSAVLDVENMIIDVGSGWTGTLTWYYQGFPYSINISTLSDITLEVIGSSGPIEVEIDIKPGSSPNPINPGSKGLIPVAILTTDEFDAADVDPGTVTLAGANVAARGKGKKLMARLEDVDGDGDFDLMLQVDTQSEGAVWTNGEVILTGKTYEELGAEDVQGSDYVVIVPTEE